MFTELVQLGQRLQEENNSELAPPCFANYGDPIEWVVHLWPDRACLREANIDCPKPFSGRTSNVEAHLLVDEAAYCLGVARTDVKGGIDKRASQKHGKFRQLVSDFRSSTSMVDQNLKTSVDWLIRAIEENWLKGDPRVHEIRSRDWVSFVSEEGSLRLKHLFEHPEAQGYWVEVMRRRCSIGEDEKQEAVYGQCAVCGEKDRLLVRKLPLEVNLGKRNPLLGLNQGSFTSYIADGNTQKKAHLGVCFTCGDLASRAFDYLSGSKNRPSPHRRLLVRHPKGESGSLVNQHALFWTKLQEPILAGGQSLTLNEALAAFSAPASDRSSKPEPTLSQVRALLAVPWRPQEASIRINETAFYVALLSPNIGRVALRDWVSVSLEDLQESLRWFLEGTNMVSSFGDYVTPVSIAAIHDAIGIQRSDLTRSLLRCAYTGSSPPESLAGIASSRLNRLLATEHSRRQRQRPKPEDQEMDQTGFAQPQEGQGKGNPRGANSAYWNEGWLQSLAAAYKLCKFWKSEEAIMMSEVNPLYLSVAYQSGRLLAVLDRAQRIYIKEQTDNWPETTSIERAYAGAVTTPKTVIGQILKISTPAHLPKAGERINVLAEQIQATIGELGGMKESLSAADQGDFGTGFYQQRSELRRRKEPTNKAQETGEHSNEQ